jgi:hypothetical protein
MLSLMDHQTLSIPMWLMLLSSTATSPNRTINILLELMGMAQVTEHGYSEAD